jgi:heme A synthase
VSSEGAVVDESSLEDSFGAHIGLGYLIFLGTLVLLLVSFGTRDRKRIYRSLGVVGLVVLQILLAWFGEGVPWVFGGLHPLNAFIILGFLASLTYREWKAKEEVAEAAPATAPPAA